jgi:hypothetical protein
MAVLYITEFNAIGGSGNFPVAGAYQPPVAEQTVAVSGSSTQSAAFNVNTLFVRLHTDAICSIEFGASPTASLTTARMAANQTEYFNVVPGQKVAVIANS